MTLQELKDALKEKGHEYTERGVALHELDPDFYPSKRPSYLHLAYAVKPDGTKVLLGIRELILLVPMRRLRRWKAWKDL